MSLRRRAVLVGLSLAPLAIAPVALAPAALAAPAPEGEAALATYAALVSRYAAPGPDGVVRVRYGAWRASAPDRAALSGVIDGFSSALAAPLPPAERFAAWANLYNAVTLKVVLDAYPIRSIRDVKSKGAGLDFKAFLGPWREKRVTVAGRALSLDDIEQTILRPQMKDPRFHYMCNCASVGCPDLRVWRGATLEQDIEAAARAYVNHPRGLALTPTGLRASSIYQWYADDFGGAAGVRRHLTALAGAELKAALSARPIAAYAYDWALNDALDAKGRP